MPRVKPPFLLKFLLKLTPLAGPRERPTIVLRARADSGLYDIGLRGFRVRTLR